jgi:hypothetical protein
MENLLCRYDFSNIRYIDDSARKLRLYLLEGENRDIALKDILSINAFLNNSPLKFTKRNIRFSTENQGSNLGIDFCWLEHTPATATGRAKKFPLILHVQTQSIKVPYNKQFNNNIFGDISYLPNGAIGKIWVAIWCNGKLAEIKKNFTY